MVAKSFQNLEIVCDPYTLSGKQYVKVKTLKGTLRQVRWYDEKEYEKYYGSPVKVTNIKFLGADGLDHSADPFFKTQKIRLGFVNGYITIFKGNTYPYKEWFKEQGATYTSIWGWSIASDKELPTEYPEGIEPIKLEWSKVGIDESETLKPDDQIKMVIDSLIYADDGYDFIGNVGDKVELFITVDKAVQVEGYYGTSTMHIMHDDNGDTYVWTTNSKSWSEGSEHHIKGTIKDHTIYKGVHQNVLTRCREVA